MEIAAHDEAQHSCGDVLTPQDTNEKLTVTELRAAISVETSEHLTDSDCLRFLRARNHDVAKASVMINHWAEWWYKPLPGTEDTEQPIRPKDAFAIPDKKEHIYREMLPHSNLGEGKYGHPVYWERTGLSKPLFNILKCCPKILFALVSCASLTFAYLNLCFIQFYNSIIAVSRGKKAPD